MTEPRLRYMVSLWGAAITILLLLDHGGARGQSWKLPAVGEASEYGNMLINRGSHLAGKPAVSFSHWQHRVHYTCRVCHLELGFEMKVNATEITEKRNQDGEYCGACHNGTIAFGHTERNCSRCHNDDIRSGAEGFRDLVNFPQARYGNGIDWSEAYSEGFISPKKSLYAEQYTPLAFDTVITMEPERSNFPPAVFSHAPHNIWLDCSNCHPDIFNIKKKTTKHFTMEFINEGRFCGVCHLSVAFPMNNCRRCHPALGGKKTGDDSEGSER